MEEKPKAIDVSVIDLEKLKEKTTETPGLLPYAHTVSGPVIRPEDQGKIKGRAMAAMQEQTNLQMRQIYRQMELLASQAKELQKRVEISEQIYLAAVGFEPLIGHIYYLYRRKDGSDVLSMVAPQEWGRSGPFEKFLAKVRMLADHTWDVLESAEDTV